MASLKAEKMALKYAKIIYLLMFVLTPFIFILDLLSGGILRMFGVDPDKRDDSVTEEDLRTRAREILRNRAEGGVYPLFANKLWEKLLVL